MKIDLASYREWARTKCPVDMTIEHQMIDAALGLAGESAELLDVTRGLELPTLRRILDEAGDVLFYAAWLLDSCGLIWVEFDTGNIPFDQICRDQDIAAVVHFGKAIESVKKCVYHARLLDERTVSHVHGGLVALHRMLVSHGSRLDIAMQFNIGKLDARYPDGFSIRCAKEDEQDAGPQAGI